MMRRVIMILLSLVCVACASLPSGNRGNTAEVSGILQGETVLEGAVVMTGDILIPAGSRLVVNPGTTIQVRKSESTKIDPEYLSSDTELLIRGSLVVEGSPERPVSFVPEESQAAGEVGWAGIIFDRATDSTVRNAILVQPDTGVLMINSSPEISGTKIIKARYGIIAQGGTARIIGNEISLGEGGIFCWNGAKPYLKDNVVVANDEEGIVVDRSSSPYVDRNTVSGNSIGLMIPGNVPYDPTMISGNDEDVRILAQRSEVLP